jgi:hypothetical protein
MTEKAIRNVRQMLTGKSDRILLTNKTASDTQIVISVLVCIRCTLQYEWHMLSVMRF